jgi:dipeptidyl aminopeptidase/acylaminoacyl peptidase
VRTIAKADISGVAAIGWKPPEEFIVKAADGKTDVYGLLYKPFNMGPSRKYPVINYVYCGPWLSIVPHAFGNGLNADMCQAMAQLGFIVFVADGRGLPNRSKAFQDATYGRVGSTEIPDQVAALRQLAATRPYMDTTRVGVFGASWGGYYTVRAMLTAPEVYSAGVAIVPGDLTQESGINEPYMGTPASNPKGYEFGSILHDADNLAGHLLLIHGTGDKSAPITTTFRLVDALVRLNKPFDMFIAPEQDHNFQGPYWTYRDRLTCEYFIKHLKP